MARRTGLSGPLLVLGHGAGAGHAHPWMTRVADGLAERGIRVVTFDFPYIEARRRVPDPGPVLETAFESVWTSVADGGPMFGGGKSMGGRIASQSAARGGFEPAPAGLVFFGYPLHPPGKPAQRRDKHLPSIAAPMLFLHGTKDPFGSPDEMRELVGTLPGATLEIIDGGDHSLLQARQKPGASASLDGAMDVAAAWIRTTVAGGL
jgi:predicted alpha/beta-hydrolase family hydrolase